MANFKKGLNGNNKSQENKSYTNSQKSMPSNEKQQKKDMNNGAGDMSRYFSDKEESKSMKNNGSMKNGRSMENGNSMKNGQMNKNKSEDYNGIKKACKPCDGKSCNCTSCHGKSCK